MSKFVNPKKDSATSTSEKLRFKSKLRGDSEENNEILVHSTVTDQKQNAPELKDGQVEVHANSANAKTEFSWGFLFWSFMNFGASNALSGHSGYWLSERNSKNDYWEANFETPVKIDSIELKWRLPPKKMKIFYKLDTTVDWIPATETFSRDELKDKDGNKIPVGSASIYNTIYFKKPLLCTQLKIMMNQPIRKNSFSLVYAKFYQQISIGIIKTTYGPKKFCWYVNTNTPRENSNIVTYPCLKSIMFSTGNEMWELTTTKLIKNTNTGLCVGYEESTKEVVLKSCKKYGSAYSINYNLDSSMYFEKMDETAIYVSKEKDSIFNYINQNTEIIVSSEADKTQYKKENMLLKGENFWASVPGEKEVTLQFFFGKIKCNCKENGKFERKIIDLIKIHWVREPLDFSVFIWNNGENWKNVGNFKNNQNQLTEMTLIAETASGIMIRISNGKNYPDFGDRTSYAIKSIIVGSKSYKLKYGKYNDKSLSTRSFDFEAQYFLNKGDTKSLENSINSMTQNFESSISHYKNIKTNFSKIDEVRGVGLEMCKKLNGFSDDIGSNAISKLNNLNQDVKKTHANFNLNLNLKTSFIQMSSEEENPIAATNFSSSGTASKLNGEDENIAREPIGNKESPGENCLHIRKNDRDSVSGFYYIKPECAEKPFRVFCDFTLFEDAVDIYIFKDGSQLPNPDLSYLDITSHKDVENQCGKYGLFPIEIHNKDTLNRIFQILEAEKMDLTKNFFVPLGYDFSCRKNTCSNIYNSISSPTTLPIMNLFQKTRNPGQEVKYNGQFAGFGLLNENSMITFNPNDVKVSALICSSNKTSGNYMDIEAKNISCSTNVSNNQDNFNQGSDTTVICPSNCADNKSKLYGNGLYHGDSSICRAALHQGVLKEDSKVIVRIQSSTEMYNGNLQNGIRSENHENDGLPAFIVVKYTPDCPYQKQNKKFSFIEEESILMKNDKDESQELINSLMEDNKKIEKNQNISPMNKMRFSQKNSKKKFPGLDGLEKSAISTAESAAKDVLGLFSGKGNPANILANDAKSMFDFSNSNAAQFQSMQQPSGNSNTGSQPISPVDIAANLSLGIGTGGTYNMSNQQLSGQNSISNPASNININGNFGGPNPYDNIPLAFSKPQTSTDPNLISSLPASALTSNMNLSLGSTQNLEAYQVPDNLLGSGKFKAGIDLGSSQMDLTNKKNLLIDPTQSSEDSDDKSLIISVETSEGAYEELNGLYDSSTNFYIENLKAKSEKISLTYRNFGSALNQAISTTSKGGIKASEYDMGEKSSDNSNKKSSSQSELSIGLGVSINIDPLMSKKGNSNLNSKCSISTISGK